MNRNHATSSPPLSSRRGRNWLKNTDKPIDIQHSSKQPDAANETVSIPDLSAPYPVPTSAIATQAQLDQLLAEATEKRLANVQTTQRQPASPNADGPKPQIDNTKRSSAAAQTRDKVSVDSGINDLVAAIIDRFPLGTPTVLLFVGSQANDHTHQTCNYVAARLAEMKIGRVLLVDGETENRSLSKFRHLQDEIGMVEVIKSKQRWPAVVQNDSDDGVYFIPAGTDVLPIVGELQKAQLRSAVAEMKHEFQFICVAGGEALDSQSQIWNSVCDGSYLLVSMKTSDQTQAKSAVTELQSSGARLIGCVVTDVEDGGQ